MGGRRESVVVLGLFPLLTMLLAASQFSCLPLEVEAREHVG